METISVKKVSNEKRIIYFMNGHFLGQNAVKSFFSVSKPVISPLIGSCMQYI